VNNENRRLLLSVSLYVVLAMLIAACGPADTPEAPITPEAPDTADTAADTADTADTQPTEEPEADELIIGGYAQGELFIDVDPSTAGAVEIMIHRNVYESLTYTGVEDTQTALPGLAVDWEASEDGMEWTFYLREGVKFHDGTDFNAEAVKFSYERHMDETLGGAYILDPIAEMNVIDDYTIQFILAYPAPMDIIAASAYDAWIVSPTSSKDPAWFNEGHDTGTGPYMIDSYEQGKRVILKRFDDYWGGWEEGQFDVVFLDTVEDSAVLQQMIESGETDITFGLPPENRSLLEARDDIDLVMEDTFIVHYFPLNTQHPPLDNKLVRQALAYTFPYQTFIDVVLEGYGEQSIGIVPPAVWGSCPDCFQYTYDLEKAQELLTEAGYPDGGFELEMVIFAGWDVSEQYAELWKAELAKLNITLNIVPMTTEAAYAKARSSPEEAQDVLGFSWWQDIVHPFAFLQLQWMCEAPDEIFFNFSYNCDPDMDEKVWAGFELSASDREAAIDLFKEVQATIIDEAWAIFVWDEVKTWYVRSDIEGFVPNPAYTAVVYWYDLKRAP
jgi:peptide/nickel transport system substrate-binding protein